MNNGENKEDSKMMLETGGRCAEEEFLSETDECNPSEWYGRYLAAYYLELKRNPERYAGVLVGSGRMVAWLRRVFPREHRC